MRKLCVILSLLWTAWVGANTLVPTIWQSPTGANVAFMPLHEVPMVDVSLLWPAGAVQEDKPGLAYLTAQALDLGSEDLSQVEIAEGFESLGMQCSTGVDHDKASYHCRMLSDDQYWRPGIALWAKLLQAPSFASSSLAQVKKEMKVAWQGVQESPTAFASLQVQKQLYPKHPYGRLVLGDPGVWSSLGTEQVSLFYHNHYTADRAWVVITGDLSMKEAKSIARQLTASMPKAKNKALPQIKLGTFASTNKAWQKPLTQTTWVLATRAPAYNDPQWWPLRVGNQILGGGMQSRLFESVRNRHGFAYAVGSSFSRYVESGAFKVYFQAKNAVADQAAEVAKKSIEAFVASGPTDLEVKQAKAQIKGAFYRMMAENGTRHSALVNTLCYVLPANHWANYLQSLEAVNQKQIQSAFKALWHQARVEVAVGGDRGAH